MDKIQCRNPGCDAWFVPDHGNQIYHDPKCAPSTQKKWIPVVIKCKNTSCGDPFLPKYHSQDYCSKICKKAAEMDRGLYKDQIKYNRENRKMISISKVTANRLKPFMEELKCSWDRMLVMFADMLENGKDKRELLKNWCPNVWVCGGMIPESEPSAGCCPCYEKEGPCWIWEHREALTK